MGTKGKDPLKPNSEAFSKRQRVRYHNSLFGGVAMARSNMKAIMQSNSTTPETKLSAQSICEQLEGLRTLLETRLD